MAPKVAVRKKKLYKVMRNQGISKKQAARVVDAVSVKPKKRKASHRVGKPVAAMKHTIKKSARITEPLMLSGPIYECWVLRCFHIGHNVRVLDSADLPSTAVLLCERHTRAIDAGLPWKYVRLLNALTIELPANWSYPFVQLHPKSEKDSI